MNKNNDVLNLPPDETNLPTPDSPSCCSGCVIYDELHAVLDQALLNLPEPEKTPPKLAQSLVAFSYLLPDWAPTAEVQKVFSVLQSILQ